MANNIKLLPGGSNIIHAPLTDKSGNMAPIWQKWFAEAIRRIQDALNKFEAFDGVIGLDATVEGRPGTVADALAHVDPVGVVLSPGLVPATDVAAGAVQLPTGAVSNALGSAALADVGDFDPAGAAAAAQAAAETASDPLGSAAAAETASKAYTDSKFAPGISGTVPLAKITGLGADGSLTFSNGLITAKVDPT